MLDDLLSALRQRRGRQQDLKNTLAIHEELPVEAFARTNDMGPLPVTLARYTELLPQRMAARLLAAGTLTPRDIVNLRNEMIQILSARYYHHTGQWSAPSTQDLYNDEKVQREAELALRLLIRAEQDEQHECRHWAHRAKYRATVLDWGRLGANDGIPHPRYSMTTTRRD